MLQTSVLFLGQLNECLAILNPWIFIPASGDRGADWRETFCLCASYAVAEPLTTLALRTSGVPPWITTLCLSPVNLFAGFVSIALHDHAFEEELPSIKDKAGMHQEEHRHQIKSAATLMPSVFSAAVLNASVLLFGQSLSATWIRERSYITHILGPFAVAIFLACRYADFEIYKRTGRPLSLREVRSSAAKVPAALCLCALFGARLCVRLLIGVAPFLAFDRLQAHRADAMYSESS